jgi:hypothetical protein
MWGRYIAMIAAEDRPTIKAMNPRIWITHTNYRDLEFALSLRAFRRQRARLLTLLRSLPEAAWSRTATVTGGGAPRERTALEYAQRLADHERSHLKQIDRRVARPSRTGAMRGALPRPLPSSRNAVVRRSRG